MKWIMYGYRCDTCHASFESLEKPETKEIECRECGQTASRAPTAGRQCDLMQKSLRLQDSKSHYRFERTRNKQRTRERKFMENHGTEFDRTPGG